MRVEAGRSDVGGPLLHGQQLPTHAEPLLVEEGAITEVEVVESQKPKAKSQI